MDEQAMQVLLQQYAVVRSDIQARLQQISTLDQIYFAAIVGVLGLGFADEASRWGLFLAAPYLSLLFYWYGQDFYHNIALSRRYLAEDIVPVLEKVVGNGLTLDSDGYARDRYAWWYRPRSQLVEWGLYVVPAAIGLWKVYGHLDSTASDIAWGVGVLASVAVVITGVVTVWVIPFRRAGGQSHAE